ncbi:hypothetical protein V1511DRAFT_411663 [Dipodascopsis uninucleata]
MVALSKRLIFRVSTGYLNVISGKNFSTSSTSLASLKYVVHRKLARDPAPRSSYWVKQFLKTGKKIKYPPYPYGDATLYKQSNNGLYGGKFPMSGHIVSEKLEKKSLRRWTPNIVKKTLYSRTLQRKISIRVATGVLKTIRKEGGLDNYLTKDKPARIKELGPRGWRLRYEVLVRRRELERASIRKRILAIRSKNRLHKAL